MSTDRLQAQRFELKYLIDRKLVPGIRYYIQSYLELDDYGVGQPTLAYPVHSLYLDSSGLETYHATLNGTKNRFKLRLRYYDDNPDTPVFFEIKARVDNCILKQRCGVRREAVPLVVAGQLPDQKQLLSREPRHLVALQRFVRLVHQLNAKPKLHNHYWREAWVSPHDNSVRVTFDQKVRVEPFFVAQPTIDMAHPTRVYSEYVILELKFTTRFPNWLRDMVEHFNLMQAAAAKYAGGVFLLGEHMFQEQTSFEVDHFGHSILAPNLLSEPELAAETEP
jgi:hypothetical protein